MLSTELTEMLGIEYPIMESGMLWLGRAELAAAVSDAGGLGIIGSANFAGAQELRDEIRKARDLTEKPLGVNISLFTQRPLPNDEFIDVALEEGIRVVESSGARSPEQYIARLRQSGVKVIHKVATVRHAVKAEQAGVDAVSVVGFEGAGHIGMDDVSTLVLIRSAVAALRVPVIAGGGIADGHGVVAALALGAQGVLMGTRFMTTRECVLPAAVKDWLAGLRETDTTIIQRSIKNPARVVANEAARRILEMEHTAPPVEELVSFISTLRTREMLDSGDRNAGILACGQGVGLIRNVPTAREAVESIVSEARAAASKLAEMGLLSN